MGSTYKHRGAAETDINGDNDAAMDCAEYLLISSWTWAKFP